MVSLHIRASCGSSAGCTSLSPIIEKQCETSDPPKSWEGLTNATRSPPRFLEFEETLTPSDQTPPHLKLPKEGPAEHEFVPFPQSECPLGMAELCAEQISKLKGEIRLRRRRRTRTIEVIEFEEEQEEGNEGQEEPFSVDDGGEEETQLPLVPPDFQLSLLEEELPPDESGADVPDLETLGEESIASSTWQFIPTPSKSPQPSQLQSSRPTSPATPRPVPPAMFAPSPSTSPSQSLSSPATPTASPIPRQSRLPRPFHLTGRSFEQPQVNRMSWSAVPPHLFEVFMGAEKEYHRLRSTIESESIFDEELYDSDATVRPSTFGRPRSQARSRRFEQPTM